MKNVFLPVLIIFITAYSVFAQTGDLIIKSSDKGLYVDHKVAPKENFYSVGRLYNAPPKEIAAFNGLDMNKGLNLGQVIHIPLSAANFSQTVNEGTPVYYKVGEKEGLMKVSNVNNKVTLENLRRWNDLKTDNVSAGNKLIVGFIVSGQLPVVAIHEPEKIKQENKPVVEKKTPVEEKKDVVVEKKEPIVEKKPTEPIENKVASPKAQLNTIVIEQPKPETSDGYFKSFFEQQVKVSPISKSETVTSGIFKTASGWQDHKYYLLIDKVQPGTIIKIVNPSNNRSVYAKVLGEMSGIRQNTGYDIRLSNAAASALEINETDKFIVKVNY
ncbi:MAG: LysM peptidoglycan-binding domain-containing protein [Bacteroidota bacterium]